MTGVQGVKSLAGRSLMSIADLSKAELIELLDCSIALKKAFKDSSSGIEKEQKLIGKSVAMIFQKRSTRTRVSTETGMGLLGGRALFLGPTDIQLGVNESMKDTAKVLSGFNSLLLARVNDHADVEELKAEARVPVINALSDLHHPLQTLADLMTIQERFGKLEGLTFTWVGDGNNVLHDLMLGAAKLAINLRIATPEGYRPDPAVTAMTEALAKESGSSVLITADPKEAVTGTHVVATDTWVSMGQEEEAAKRIKDYEGYQVTDELMSLAADDAIFMHCLPRHKEEVDDAVFYSERSVVFPEAENRMWTVMALMQSMLDM
ncbi:ornithine transcarbamoylase [Ectocarpus siliculosus]|uniref:ornithine carbamoyltransferase n=1 Tax=Ectocarpus siliculosus TaxID=2880 RepID=D8LLH5_ECTSI|nr:ornithine transcarbamoylase [Ectocarpus siliculosus]|eukprot:CBN76155.1 ornithine transcarbamoylase [Ectocarpus siliculosus]